MDTVRYPFFLLQLCSTCLDSFIKFIFLCLFLKTFLLFAKHIGALLPQPGALLFASHGVNLLVHLPSRFQGRPDAKKIVMGFCGYGQQA